MSERDTSKLPKWAQQTMERLERDTEYWKRKATTGPDGSNTFIRNGSADDDTPLGDSPNITFVSGDHFMQRFDVRIDEGRLLITGGDLLRVYPRAGNSIEVALERFSDGG